MPYFRGGSFASSAHEGAGKDITPAAPGTDAKSTAAPQEPTYQVGDTVYLEDTAYIVEEIGLFDVQLRDPTLAYPVLRAESKERLERMLWADVRNNAFLPGTKIGMASTIRRCSGSNAAMAVCV